MSFLSAAVTIGTTAYGVSQANSASQKAAQQYQQALNNIKSTLSENSGQVRQLMNPYVQSGTLNLTMLNSALDPTRTQQVNIPTAPTHLSENPSDYLTGLAGMVKAGRAK